MSFDDSAIGGQPGEYSRLGWIGGAVAGVLGKAAHGLFKSGRRYEQIITEQKVTQSELVKMRGEIETIKATQEHRAELYEDVAVNVAGVAGELQGMKLLLTTICNNTTPAQHPMRSLSTPSPDWPRQ